MFVKSRLVFVVLIIAFSVCVLNIVIAGTCDTFASCEDVRNRSWICVLDLNHTHHLGGCYKAIPRQARPCENEGDGWEWHYDRSECYNPENPDLPVPQHLKVQPIATVFDDTVRRILAEDTTEPANITPRTRDPFTKAIATPPPTNVLKITRVSHDEVVGRGGIRSNMVLTVELTAYAPDTQHNLLVITVNGHNFRTPIDFFGTVLLNTNDRRTVELHERVTNNAVYMKVLDPRNDAWLSNNRAGWETIERFDKTSFTISISDTIGIRDSVTQMHFDTNGNRIEIAPAAPSSVRKKYGVWAALKRRNR